MNLSDYTLVKSYTLLQRNKKLYEKQIKDLAKGTEEKIIIKNGLPIRGDKIIDKIHHEVSFNYFNNQFIKRVETNNNSFNDLKVVRGGRNIQINDYISIPVEENGTGYKCNKYTVIFGNKYNIKNYYEILTPGLVYFNDMTINVEGVMSNNAIEESNKYLLGDSKDGLYKIPLDSNNQPINYYTDNNKLKDIILSSDKYYQDFWNKVPTYIYKPTIRDLEDYEYLDIYYIDSIFDNKIIRLVFVN